MCSSLIPYGRLVKSLLGPLYDGKYLHSVLKDELQSIKLSQAITDVIIPAFDIKRMQPVIFSTYEVPNFKFTIQFSGSGSTTVYNYLNWPGEEKSVTGC